MRLSKHTVTRLLLPGAQLDQRHPVRQGFMRVQQGWQTLAPREQTFVLFAGLVGVLAVVWWVAIAPAIAVRSKANTQQTALDSQLQLMKSLQAEARLVQAQPKITASAAVQALEASTKEKFGPSGQMAASGSQATLTLRGASGDALAQWLSQARLSARAVPVQAQLRRTGTDPGKWEGTVVLSLPAP